MKLKPVAKFNAEPQVCIANAASFTDASCNESSHLWDFGDGTTSTLENPTHKYSAPGMYSVKLTVTNECGQDQTTKTITVVDYPKADFKHQLNGSFHCGPLIDSFTNLSNSWSNTTWKITPADTTKWMFTDTLMKLNSKHIKVNFKKPGRYIVQLTATNECGEDVAKDTIDIYEPPMVSIKAPPVFCDKAMITTTDLGFTKSGEITEFKWIFTNGNPGSATGTSFPPVTFNISGSVTLIALSPCGNDTITVPITVAVTDPISFSGNPTGVCVNGGTVQLNATPAGGQWTGKGPASSAITSGGLLDPSKLAPGSYTFNYSVGSVDCPNNKDYTIQILPGVEVALASPPVFCDKAELDPGATFGGDISSYQWTFSGGNPNSSSQKDPGIIQYGAPGTYPVVLVVSGKCGTATDTVTLVIQASTPIVIAPVPPLVCSTSSPFQLSASVPGGTWSGPGITDPSAGIFDPAQVTPGQDITISYGFQDGPCQNSASIVFKVLPAEAVKVNDELLCEDSPPIQLKADKPGGTWTGSGITDPSTGVFDAQVSGIGNFPVKYDWTDPQGCPVSTTANVTVEAFPVIGLSDTTLLCLTGDDITLATALGFSVDPAGGQATWSGPGIADPKGTFNSMKAGLAPGYYTVRVIYTRNACVVSDSAVIQLIANPVLSLSADTTICINEGSLQLDANLASGTWSGPGIDPQSGMIDLSAAGGGVKAYGYIFEKGSSCEQSGQVQVEIIDPASGLDPGKDSEVCEGPSTFQFTGFSPPGGTWSGPGVLSASTGLIDLTALALDTFYTFTYCLESSEVDSCSACRTRKLRINARPEIEFTFDGLPCINEKFSVVNNTTNATGHAWNFGDQVTSGQAEPSHTYLQPGTFTLTYVATSALGCKDTLQQQIFVTTPPVADFSLLADEGCAPFLVEVTNQSSGYQISQLWIIQEDSIPGVDPGEIYIDHIFSDTLMTIRLEVTNVCGTRIAEEQVLVHPYPVVDFGFNVDEGCSPLFIEFANVTLGNPETFLWDLGNGVLSTDTVPPAQTYVTQDTSIAYFPITLISTNECGADTLTKTITVYPPDVKAFIEMDTLEGCEPFLVSPKSYSTPGSKLSWVVQDPAGNTVLSSNASSPEFEVNGAGLYRIVLYASRCGTDTDTAWFNVLPAPEVGFAHPSYVCQGSEIAFSDQSVGTTGYLWDLGDGNTSTEIEPIHRYDQPGKYLVTLTAYSLLNNCPASAQSEVLVVGKPDSKFDPGSVQGCAPLSVPFQNQTTGIDSLLFIWTFGDGSSASFENEPVHVFGVPGQYDVSLVSYDAFGCFSDTVTGIVIVHPDPVASFEVSDLSLCQGRDTLFLTNKSQEAVSYLWRIDGWTSTDAEPFHVPKDVGSIEVVLEAVNKFQCRDTARLIVSVIPSPIASTLASVTEGCEDLVVQFGNASLNGTAYVWDFGDGNTSVEKEPEHLYLNPGSYSARLTVSSDNGCPEDTASVAVQVWPTPVVDFSWLPSHLCGVPMTIAFDNLSSGTQGQEWTFGDGNSSGLFEPSHVFTEVGMRSVRLIGTNVHGCRDTLEQEIDIYGQPVADFELLADEGCQGFALPLMNSTTDALAYEWRVGPGLIFEGRDPLIAINDTGTYTIRLIASYNELCKDTLDWSGTVRIFLSPDAAFTWTADEQENIIGDVEFTNISTSADRYRWDLGDGTISLLKDPIHEYDINRDIRVELLAFNDNGGAFTCIDTAVQIIEPEWITTFYAPNAMTPGYGAEGIRIFKPVGIGIQEYEINVYSPWGELVWTSTELEDNRPSGFWDGSYRGQIVSQGAFTWVARMQFVNGVVRLEKGTVTVVR